MTGLALVLYLVTFFSDCSEAAKNRADYEHDMSTTTSRYGPSYYDVRHERRRYYYGPTDCGAAAGFEITTIILLISLVATTARSAYLLRQIEQSMPGVAVLPPGKMVTQTDQLVPLVPHPIDNVNDEKSESTDGAIILATSV